MRKLSLRGYIIILSHTDSKLENIHTMKFHVEVKVNESKLNITWKKNIRTIKLRGKRKLQINLYRRIPFIVFRKKKNTKKDYTPQ